MILAPSAAVAAETQSETIHQDAVENLTDGLTNQDLSVENLFPVTVADASITELSAAEPVVVEPNLNVTSVDELSANTDSLGQVTSVSQLSDVQPTDWAFQALQSLVERYGCIAGYPNGTFRGNRSATRYEMAAALNACLDQISDRFASKADLDAVKALQDEFAAELATLRGRVDGLEARVDTVEAQQFSTTTKLNGEVVFGSAFVFDEDNALDSVLGVDTDDGNTGEDRLFLGYRARLNFDTSFSGSDRLRIRLEAADIPELDEDGSAGTSLARFGFDENDPEGNLVILDELNYRFKPFDKLTLKVALQGGDYKDDVETFNPYLKSSGSGALSRFFRFNPTTHRAPGDTTFSAVYELNDAIELSFAAAADDAELATADDDNNGGLFGGGQFGVFGQIGV
ncbi:MAG: iron uptake porin, partial [Cyanobacteria bacterium P01_A01_bin.17]